MADHDQDKTEQPTPFRLQEARKKGQVPRSADFGGALVMLAFCVAMAVAAAGVARGFAVALRRSLLLAGNAPAPSRGLVHWLAATFAPGWQALTPVVLTIVVVAVAANLVQTGGVFSTHPIKPDPSRLNPAQH